MRFVTHTHEFVSADEYRNFLGLPFMMALVLLDENQIPAGAAGAADHSQQGGVTTTNAPTSLTPAQEHPAPGRTPSLVAQAGALCANEEFWRYLIHRWNMQDTDSKDKAAQGLRFLVKVNSRKDILPHTQAEMLFHQILDDFSLWRVGQ